MTDPLSEAREALQGIYNAIVVDNLCGPIEHYGDIASTCREALARLDALPEPVRHTSHDWHFDGWLYPDAPEATT